MSKITISINNQEIKADPGQTILEAARAHNIYIPTLCYHPQLSVFGGCRLCLVEIEGVPKLMPSCSTPITEGMKIITNNEKISNARKFLIELILSDHNCDCIICEKNGDCELQNLAYAYGIIENRFTGEAHNYPIEDNNPVIERDLKKCILCGRCVRVCKEIQGVGAIDFVARGFKTKVGTSFDKALNCEFCGQCIGVCPVGALTSKISKFKGRIFETEKVDTICPYCGCGCNLTLHIKDDKIVKVTSGDDTINEGFLCGKGRFGFDFVHHKDRLTKPLIRKDNRLVEAEWDEAINYIASKLKDIKKTHGPDSIAGLSSAKCTNEENYLFQKMMRAAIGTNNVDHCARL